MTGKIPEIKIRSNYSLHLKYVSERLHLFFKVTFSPSPLKD